MKTKSSPSKPTPIGGIPAPLAYIEASALEFAREHALLAHVISEVNRQLTSLQATAVTRLRPIVGRVSGIRTELYSLIDSHRSLFEKPRTRIFSDIKVGLQKQKGQTVIADPEKTIALIKKHFPDLLDDLAPATRALSKTALASMTASDLKKIGVEITADTDAILIKPQDSDVEKAVAALLKDSTPA